VRQYPSSVILMRAKRAEDLLFHRVGTNSVTRKQVQPKISCSAIWRRRSRSNYLSTLTPGDAMRSTRWTLLVLLLGFATACPKKGYLRPDAGAMQTHPR
jgi:hypothetical protein